ncbi:MAG TPA: ABC transporter ATP-binding protein, partial [Polyangiaceae bacterium]|nr:ABC transporter ATP-binding protein [Polyangiaceae bacterium]
RQRVAANLLRCGSGLPAGQLSARFAVHVRELEVGVENGFLGGLRAILTLVPLVGLLFALSSRLAWAAMLALLPFVLVTTMARRAWKRSHRMAVSVAEGLHEQLDELVVHMDVWRAFGAGDRVASTLARLGNQAARLASRAEGARAAISSANEVLAAAALLLCVVTARALSLPLGDGALVAFAAVFFMSYRPLRDLGDARAALDRGVLALAELERLALVGDARTSPAPARAGAWERATLEVIGVGLDVEGERGARGRERTSFVAHAGEIVAIVGPTGSGKTTLLRALLGLEASAAGVVRYGDEELSHRGVGPRERPFAWVPQDAPVLAGTLHENVLLGPNEAGAAEAALAKIGAERLIGDCEDDWLGATGRPVSGGERKWIGLARALATNLPVLLLDEPTAGLDAVAERRILASLDKLRGERTIVLVSHQPEVVRVADRIVRVGTDGSRVRTERGISGRSRT